MTCLFCFSGGCNIEGEDDSWDFGSGAGFYVDASEDKWKNNYRMFSYVTKELPSVIAANFPVNPTLQSIMGHRYLRPKSVCQYVSQETVYYNLYFGVLFLLHFVVWEDTEP